MEEGMKEAKACPEHEAFVYEFSMETISHLNAATEIAEIKVEYEELMPEREVERNLATVGD
jgi:hypothetical protein